MQVKFSYNGTPIGKGRPRAAKNRAGDVYMYTPKETHDFEKALSHSYINSTNFKFNETDVLHAEILIKMPILKSFTKKQREQALSGELLPAKKPDIDNIIKIVFDGLNGVCYPDDNQIVSVTARKIYSEEPGLDITISTLE